jgi:hypothetical protein
MIAVHLHNSERQRLKIYSVNVPEQWDELSKKQLLEVANILQMETNTYKLQVRLVKALCTLKKYWLIPMDAEVFLNDLMPLVAFIQTDCDLTEQLIPTLRLNRVKLYGPKSFLRNLKLGEFDAAERALFKFNQEPTNTLLLLQFVAIIYRLPKHRYNFRLDRDGDPRQDFNSNIVEYWAAQLAKAYPDYYAIAIMIWYKGCRNYIINRFSHIFSSTEDSEANEQPAYFELMRAIARKGIYGTFEQVENMYLYTALHEITCAMEEKALMEEQLNQRDYDTE